MSKDPLWVALPASTFPLSQTTVLALNRESVDVIELTPLTAGILGRCQAVRPLTGHTAAGWLSGLSPSPTAVANSIDVLVSLGLLRPAELSAGAPGAPAITPTPVATVVIITCDRADALERALGAWGGGQVVLSDGPTLHNYLVVDGSRRGSEATRAVATPSDKGASCVSYVGADAARDLRQAMGKANIPGHVLDAALTPGGIGSNRNIGLLLTAGGCIVMQDDDVVATPWMAEPDLVGGITLGGHADLREWSFFDSRDEAMASVTPVGQDLREVHSRVLGWPLAALLVDRFDHVDFGPACGHMAAAVAEAERCRVRVTFCGLVGDAARYCSHSVIFRPGPLRNRFWNEEATFRRATRSREVSVISPNVLVTHDSSCVGYCMGIDNTSLVPPFMPSGQNEDGVWGATLSFMDPSALFAHLPVGIRHESNRQPAYQELMSSARHTRIADLLLFVANRVARATFALTPADRLVHLGALLTQAGSLPLSDFRLLVAEARLSTLAGDIAQADAATKDPACPTWWRDAIGEYERTFRKHVVAPDFFLPIEFKGTPTLDEGFAAAQGYVRSFGEILTWWPAMWEASFRLRSSQAGRVHSVSASLGTLSGA